VEAEFNPSLERGSAGGRRVTNLPGLSVADRIPEAIPERRVAERRLHQRYVVDCAASVILVKGGAPVAGRITDISLGGCRMATDHRYPPEMLSRVEVELALNGVALRIAGVSVGGRGAKRFAVRFLDLSERKQNQLAELIDELQEAMRKEEASRSDSVAAGETAAGANG
jgi:hypothetical protein